jgi:hypothetical protein
MIVRQVPSRCQRRNSPYADCHGPYAVGTSRQGDPVRVRQRIPSMSCRLAHFGGRPAFLPRGSRGSSTLHSESARSWRPAASRVGTRPLVFTLHHCAAHNSLNQFGGVCLLPVSPEAGLGRSGISVSWTTYDLLMRDPRRHRVYCDTRQAMNAALRCVLAAFGYQVARFGCGGAWLAASCRRRERRPDSDRSCRNPGDGNWIRASPYNGSGPVPALARWPQVAPVVIWSAPDIQCPPAETCRTSRSGARRSTRIRG